MYALVPDDPVFFAKFQSLEEPLLRHLYRLHTAGRESDEERIVAEAYDSWVRILVKLPLWSDWHAGDMSADRPSPEPPGYTLYGGHGRQLTSLYPVELSVADLGHLTACLDLFIGADAEPACQETEFVEVLRRVMEVLLLPYPQDLLAALRDVVPAGPLLSVTLADEREAEYRSFCERIVTVLSSGDSFAHHSHLAMYP